MPWWLSLHNGRVLAHFSPRTYKMAGASVSWSLSTRLRHRRQRANRPQALHRGRRGAPRILASIHLSHVLGLALSSYRRPPDLGPPAEAFEPTDEPRGGVHHAPPCAMAGPGGGGVGGVVPVVTEGHDGQQPQVGAAVPRPVRPLAEGVAQRVDRPGDVVEERHPH